MFYNNEQKLDEITRKLGVQEDESKRATERAELAEGKLKDVEQELETIGENMKKLESHLTLIAAIQSLSQEL